MRSMRLPLGSIDTRVTMTDSLADGLLSPSFASVLVFDGSPYGDQALDEMCLCAEDSHKPVLDDDAREVSQKAYPRLDLNALMDTYHALDGFAEPTNPQNTPASNSDRDSPDEAGRHRKREKLRTTSAPHLTLPLLESQVDKGMEYSLGEGGDDSRAQKRRFSADDEPQSTSMTMPLKRIDSTPDVKHIEDTEDFVSSLRYVRFTPPAEPAQPRSPRLAQRPLPSVERKQDYIASYRQSKQYAKWNGSNRALAQRVSPYRSPPKMPKSVKPPFRQPEIRLSSVPKMQACQGKIYTDSTRETTEDLLPRSVIPVAKETGCAQYSARPRQAYDLVAVTFGVYRFQYPDSDPRGGVFQIRMDTTVIPPSTLLRATGKERNAVIRTDVEDLLLQTCVIMPSFVLRVPLAIVSGANRFAQSRICLVTINVLRILWAISVKVAMAMVSRLLGQARHCLPAEMGLESRHEGYRTR